ncbi:Transcription factor RelB [Oryzias melastigma]|uniref:Transcription factor RelB n=1 Tax=Oryzias melastigma TaxID=30732 RepID=A0A3B3C2X1_ORYME|nr:transcription factor RelB isoform X2 [Oryzias melastigma]KAF6736875.1 Transcription factor RelB [Oryzias melastigma]
MKDTDYFNGASAEEPTPNPGNTAVLTGSHDHFSSSNRDFEFIEEYIKEQKESQRGPLPGPPPPPQDLLGQSPRSVRQNGGSKAVLVARGATCKPNFHQLQVTADPSREMTSPRPSRVSCASGHSRGGSSYPSAVSSQGTSSTDLLEQILEKPRLVVVEEPKDRGMRFRYECEGRSAGSILGASSTDNHKTQPAIEIQGPIDHLKRVTVTVSLVTKDLPHRPHPHCLVGKDCPLGSGICVVSFNPHNNRCHSFANLGIQCVRRKELEVSLQKRRSQNIDPFQTGHSKGIEDMDMNVVRLCFQCSLEWDDGRKDSLSPVVSKPIYDKKATTTSELRICHLNQYRGSCRGKTEIYMLCDKVQKDDIEIIFRHGSWKASGEFAQTDVHRQIAIVFKTPPYQDQDISGEVEVQVSLRRVSDQMESEPVTFVYFPHNQDPYEVKRKRATIKRDITFSEKPCVTAESAAAPEQAACALLDNQSMLLPEAPCGVDSSYTETQNSSSMFDEAAILSQLLELPEISQALSDTQFFSAISCGFDPGLEAISATVDLNFNQNFSTYPQDFAHFSDMQFNMLVNESQSSQAEAQDGTVQVKMEEDL